MNLILKTLKAPIFDPLALKEFSFLSPVKTLRAENLHFQIVHFNCNSQERNFWVNFNFFRKGSKHVGIPHFYGVCWIFIDFFYFSTTFSLKLLN